MGWALRNDRQIWLQLVELLTQRIVSGQYPAGIRIPSVRELAAEAGVNPNTMQRALAALEESGLLTAARNTGRFVTRDEALLETTRRRLAEDELAAFFEKMRLLGYGRQEAEQFLLHDSEGERQ